MCGAWAKAGFARVAPPTSEHKPRVQKVIQFARHQLGVRYSWGGTSRRTGFDCSGLVYAAYRSIGRAIPHSSWDQLRLGRSVRFGRLRAGDLLFTEGGGHVVLVISKTTVIEAPQTGERVHYVDLASLGSRFA